MNVPELFDLPWGPLLIFGLRVADVSIDTMRVLFAVRGKRYHAASLGFFQALIFILVVGNVLQHLGSVWHVLGYAAGFATGTLVGVQIENAVAYGLSTVRIVSPHGGVEIANALREHKIDCVMHFAAYAYVGESVEKPLMYYQNNVATTINVLEGLLAHERATGGSPKAIAARRRGEEYLLERKLLRRKSTGEVVDPATLHPGVLAETDGAALEGEHADRVVLTSRLVAVDIGAHRGIDLGDGAVTHHPAAEGDRVAPHIEQDTSAGAPHGTLVTAAHQTAVV